MKNKEIDSPSTDIKGLFICKDKQIFPTSSTYGDIVVDSCNVKSSFETLTKKTNIRHINTKAQFTFTWIIMEIPDEFFSTD